MSACQQAAADSAWDRHVGQALEQSRQRQAVPAAEPRRPRLVLAGAVIDDDMAAPSGAHPAARAIRRNEGHLGTH